MYVSHKYICLGKFPLDPLMNSFKPGTCASVAAGTQLI